MSASRVTTNGLKMSYDRSQVGVSGIGALLSHGGVCGEDPRTSGVWRTTYSLASCFIMSSCAKRPHSVPAAIILSAVLHVLGRNGVARRHGLGPRPAGIHLGPTTAAEETHFVL